MASVATAPADQPVAIEGTTDASGADSGDVGYLPDSESTV